MQFYKKQERLRQDYNAALNWKPWKNITFRTEFGYGWRNEKADNAWAADAVQNSRYGFNGQPQLRFSTRDVKRWRNANTVTYDNKKLFDGRDHINVLFGQEWSSQKQTDRTNVSVAFPATMTISEILANAAAGTALPNETDIKAKENMFSFFGRVNYTLMGKYLATLTLRADGSSKFGDDHRWGYFPAAALAWRLSDEDYLKELEMAFKSVGQKYGFVSAGDVFRKRLADAHAETQQKVAEARAEARQEGEAVGETRGERKKACEMAKALKAMGDSTEKIVAVSGLTPAEVEAL